MNWSDEFNLPFVAIFVCFSCFEGKKSSDCLRTEVMFCFCYTLDSILAAWLPLFYLRVLRVICTSSFQRSMWRRQGQDGIHVGDLRSERWHLTGAQIIIQQTQNKHTSGQKQSLNTPICPRQDLSVIKRNPNTGSKPNEVHKNHKVHLEALHGGEKARNMLIS